MTARSIPATVEPTTTTVEPTTTTVEPTTTTVEPKPLTVADRFLAALAERGESRTAALESVARTIPKSDRAAVVADLAMVPALGKVLPQVIAMLIGATPVPFGRDPREALRENLADHLTWTRALIDAATKAGVTIPTDHVAAPDAAMVERATKAVERWSSARGASSGSGRSDTRTDQGRDTAEGRVESMRALIGKPLFNTYKGKLLSAQVVERDGAPVALLPDGRTFSNLSDALNASIKSSGLFGGLGKVSRNGWQDYRVGAADGPRAADFVKV